MDIRIIIFWLIISGFALALAIVIAKKGLSLIKYVRKKIERRIIDRRTREYAEYCRKDVEITTKVWNMINESGPIHLCDERVIWFNNLPKTDQRNFLDFIRNTARDLDGDVIWLGEAERAVRLRQLFPSEDLFDPKEKVVVRGVVSMYGRVIHMCIVFPEVK